MFHSLKGIFQM